MKRSLFAILLAILITLSCLFASCGTMEELFQDQQPSDTDEYDLSQLIQRLEAEIASLKENQTLSETERQNEIKRLEELILKLTSEDNYTETDTEETPLPNSTLQFLYTVDNGEATITGYNGTDTILTLPTHIDGYKVTAIGDNAFSSNHLQSVIIPDSITRIGWFSFKECPSLRSVTLSASVKSIGYSAFAQGTSGLTLICPADSFAAKYAASYGISVTPL